MTSDLERGAVQLALTQGWLTPDRLREALLLREHLRATGRTADLLPLLAARFLHPEHARELSRRVLASSSPGSPGLAPVPPMMPQDLERSVDLARRPAEQDPAAVRQFMAGLPGLAAMARNATVSLAPGAAPGPAAPARVLPQQTGMPRRLGPYEVVRELARGGMGAVYVARHTTLDREVALKVLLGMDAGRLKRFEIEARATARLRHPNLVPIHEVGEEGGVRYLVMDLIEGESLKDRIEREGPLDPREAARLVATIARALQYAHEKGVLHRDMKPSNVLLDTTGQPLVTDFGLAKEVEGEDKLTVTGQMIGTPVYMPPEQATAAKDRIDARSDVYSIGATFYEMLTGAPPFQGDHLMNIVVAVVREPPEPPWKRRPGLDRALSEICLRCLEKEPAQRYPSAGALAADLERWLAGDAPATAAGGARVATPVVAASALVAVLALTLAGWQWLDARAVRRARVEEQAALVALAAATRGSPEEAAARSALEAALDDDPSLVDARVALAESLMRAGADDEAVLARVERLLAPLTSRPGDHPGAAYLLGRLAEARGRDDEALLAYEAAAAGRSPEALPPDLAHHLAAARAGDRERRGWSAAAEAARWDALRAAPDDGAPLAAIAAARLLDDDPEAVARLWEEAHRRLGRPGEPDLQQRGRAETLPLARALREADTPPRERLRAVIAAAGLLRDDVQVPLRALAGLRGQGGAAVAEAPPLLAEAARASLLAQGEAAPGPLATARRTGLEGWAAAVAAGAPPHEGALAAITLLEQAPWLGPDDQASLERLARAQAPLLRVALALTLAVSATRDEGLALDRARALLRGLARDDDARVASSARVALAALDALAPGASSDAPADDDLLGRAALLARRLARLPGLAAPLGAPGHAPALTRALERRPTAPLWLAQAWDALERGEPEPAQRAVERALALDATFAPALELRAQLAVLRGEATADADPLAAITDPEAARAARARLEFTRRHGVPALPAPAGALRAVVSLRAGSSARGFADALSVSAADLVELTANGLVSKQPLHLRTRFAFSASHAVRIEGAPLNQDKLQVWLGATHDGGVGDGLLMHAFNPTGETFFSLDHVFLVDATVRGRPGRDRFEGRWTRPFAGAWLDGRVVGRVHVPARERVGVGTGFVEYGWGGGCVRALIFEGVWDPDAPAPRQPDAARRRAFEASLAPVDGEVALRSVNRQIVAPTRLSELRAEQLVLLASRRWHMYDRWAEAVLVPEVVGDFEVRVQVTFPASPSCSAGLMLLPSRDRGDALWFGPGGAPDHYGVALSTQRDMIWEKPQRRVPWTPERPVLLVVQRIGDFVFLRAGPSADRLEDFGEPLYFPFDGPVDVGLCARNFDQTEPYVVARFDGFDLRVGR